MAYRITIYWHDGRRSNCWIEWHLSSSNSSTNRVAAIVHFYVDSQSVKVEPHINPLDLIVHDEMFLSVCVCSFELILPKDKSNLSSFE